MRALVAACALLLGAFAASASQAGTLPPTPDWDMVAFETKSWGAKLSSWMIVGNGGGSWTEAVRAEGELPSADAALAWHTIEPDAENVAALDAILARLPATAPDPDFCGNMMSDMPYGTLRITRGATTTEIAWNSGCLDDDYQDFIAVLKEADTLVAEKGKATPPTRVEQPSGS